MPCCSYEDFKDGFLGVWKKARNAPNELLIDWSLAKTAWRKYHATPGEAARYQLTQLSNEAEYAIVERINNFRRGGDDGNWSGGEQPKTPTPAPELTA